MSIGYLCHCGAWIEVLTSGYAPHICSGGLAIPTSIHVPGKDSLERDPYIAALQTKLDAAEKEARQSRADIRVLCEKRDELEAELALATEALREIGRATCNGRCCLCKTACCPMIFTMADEAVRELEKP